MRCRACHREMDETPFCPWCGTKQDKQTVHRHRANGEGTVYRRGATWTAKKRISTTAGEKAYTKGGFRTKAEAYAWLSSPTKKERDALITWDELYTRFLERHAERVTKSTLGCYKAAYGHFMPLYSQIFADLTTEDWQECVDEVDGKRTRQNMKALGTLMYKFAKEQQITTEDYAQYIWIGAGEKTEKIPFSSEQLKKLYDAAHDDEGAALIIIDCFTGFRPSELFKLRKDDCSEAWLVGGAKTEAGKNRRVPVPTLIQPIVRKFLARCGEYVFKRRGIVDGKDWREKSFYPTLARLGIQAEDDHTLTPYSCRHTYATMLKSADGSVIDKIALMGHTSASMTAHYQHATDGDKARIAEQIGGNISSTNM